MILRSLGDLLWILLFFPLFVLCSFCLLPGLLRILGKRRRADSDGASGKAGSLKGVQAAFTTLAATVGTGNIIGTAQAIAMGGPGAIFWMWAAAVLGFSVKSAEIWFGQQRGRGASGTISAALGPGWAGFYCVTAVLSTLSVGNMAQMNTVVLSLSGGAGSSFFDRLPLGLALLLLLSLALIHGVEALGKLCTLLVPCMTLLFLLCASALLLRNREALLPALRSVAAAALQPDAVGGGFLAFGTRNAILWGFRRGVFSNEAGLGTAGTVHALVAGEDPDRQARWAVLEIAVDTLLLCSVSALTLLSSGAAIPYGSMPGAELWVRVFSSAFSSRLPALLLTLCLFSFGFSTVLASYVPGSLCAAQIGLGERTYRPIFLLCAALGSFLPTEFIWLSSDLLNGCMAAPNLLSMLRLAPAFRTGCEQSKNNLEKTDFRSCPEWEKGVR